MLCHNMVSSMFRSTTSSTSDSPPTPHREAHIQISLYEDSWCCTSTTLLVSRVSPLSPSANYLAVGWECHTCCWWQATCRLLSQAVSGKQQLVFNDPVTSTSAAGTTRPLWVEHWTTQCLDSSSATSKCTEQYCWRCGHTCTSSIDDIVKNTNNTEQQNNITSFVLILWGRIDISKPLPMLLIRQTPVTRIQWCCWWPDLVRMPAIVPDNVILTH